MKYPDRPASISNERCNQKLVLFIFHQLLILQFIYLVLQGPLQVSIGQLTIDGFFIYFESKEKIIPGRQFCLSRGLPCLKVGIIYASFKYSGLQSRLRTLFIRFANTEST